MNCILFLSFGSRTVIITQHCTQGWFASISISFGTQTRAFLMSYTSSSNVEMNSLMGFSRLEVLPHFVLQEGFSVEKQMNQHPKCLFLFLFLLLSPFSRVIPNLTSETIIKFCCWYLIGILLSKSEICFLNQQGHTESDRIEVTQHGYFWYCFTYT